MASFIDDKIVMDGLTFDDVLLIPAYSEVLPKTVELKTKFSRNIELNVPFVTAAMDTVTESQMAIAIARETCREWYDLRSCDYPVGFYRSTSTRHHGRVSYRWYSCGG